MKSFVFEINEKINPNFLGIIIGPFKCFKPETFASKIWYLP